MAQKAKGFQLNTMRKLLLLLLLGQAMVLRGQTIYERFSDFAPCLQQQNDTVYVINFWATWCAPCIEELPYFEQLHQEYRSRKVKVLLVSMDFRKDLETKLNAFLQRRQFSTPVVALLDSDYDNWIEQVDPQWTGSIPATLVIHGKNRKFIEDEFADYPALKSLIEPMLESK
jgi:thiol-disulfide isomerase/thioredoxin